MHADHGECLFIYFLGGGDGGSYYDYTFVCLLLNSDSQQLILLLFHPCFVCMSACLPLLLR